MLQELCRSRRERERRLGLSERFLVALECAKALDEIESGRKGRVRERRCCCVVCQTQSHAKKPYGRAMSMIGSRLVAERCCLKRQFAVDRAKQKRRVFYGVADDAGESIP